ncbi:MAG TPA: cytochrome b5 domain-containing protein [Clostridiaceae bacterium]
MKKVANIFLISLLIITGIIILFTACSTTSSRNVPSKTFTTAELSTYDGQNGNAAYIAVDGVVYDVTNVQNWASGSHHGYVAGKDYTNEIKTKTSHGTSVLGNVTAFGKLK